MQEYFSARTAHKQARTRQRRHTLCEVVATEDDSDGTLGAHDSNLGRRPRIVAVAAEVLGAHHIVRTAVRLARDHSLAGVRGGAETCENH